MILKPFLQCKNYTENHVCLPFGTLSLLVMRNGSARPTTVPSSEAQVSPLLHAKAPASIIINKLRLNGNTCSEFKQVLYLYIFSKWTNIQDTVVTAVRWQWKTIHSYYVSNLQNILHSHSSWQLMSLLHKSVWQIVQQKSRVKLQFFVWLKSKFISQNKNASCSYHVTQILCNIIQYITENSTIPSRQ